jgi:hypothetical protein
VTFKAKAVADQRLPGHRQHPGAGAALAGRIHDHRQRIRRILAAADWPQLLPAQGRKAPHRGLPDLLEVRSSKKSNRKSARRSRPPVRSRQGRKGSSSSGNESKRPCRLNRSTRPAAESRVHHRWVTRRLSLEIMSSGTYVAPGRWRRLRPELIVQSPRRSTRCRARPTRRSKGSSSRLGSAIKKGGKTIYYGTTAEEVPQGRLPAQDGTDLRRTVGERTHTGRPSRS